MSLDLLICSHKRNAYCSENLEFFQSVDIPWTGDFAAECHEKTVLFLNKEETPHTKWRL